MQGDQFQGAKEGIGILVMVSMFRLILSFSIEWFS